MLELLGRENSRAQLMGSGIRLGASCQQCRCQLTYVTICLHCIFIGPESDHWECLSLTNSCLVNLIDVPLACEDANSKLIEVVTVVTVVACWQQIVADLGAEVWSQS